MRSVARGLAVGAVMACAIALAGCGRNAEEKRAQADANAADFRPPSVTSRIDFGTAMDRRFRALDRNADDRITKDELPRVNSRIAEFDRNTDGIVTAIEWSEGTLRRFDQMDLNRDGTVTSEEQAEWRRARSQGRDPVRPTLTVPGDPLANNAAPAA